MSVVIALKYKDGVILGADKQVSSSNIKSNSATKIHKSKYSQTAIGVCGCLRDLDLISCNIDDLMEYKDILDNVEIDKKYVVNNIVDNIFRLLERYKRLNKENEVMWSDSIFLVASQNKIFTLGSDGSVKESNDYAAIGCGDELVKGYLDTTINDTSNITEKQAEAIIDTAIKMACKDDIYIGDEIDYIYLKKGVQK